MGCLGLRDTCSAPHATLARAEVLLHPLAVASRRPAAWRNRPRAVRVRRSAGRCGRRPIGRRTIRSATRRQRRAARTCRRAASSRARERRRLQRRHQPRGCSSRAQRRARALRGGEIVFRWSTLVGGAPAGIGERAGLRMVRIQAMTVQAPTAMMIAEPSADPIEGAITCDSPRPNVIAIAVAAIVTAAMMRFAQAATVCRASQTQCRRQGCRGSTPLR